MSSPVYQTVIVGGGFTGLFTALHLSHQHYPRSVILIDASDRFCFKPLLYEYFSSEMDAMQVLPCFQELLQGSGVIFVQDTVQSIDLQNKQVKLSSGDCYNYSNLVLAVGSVTGYFGVKGAKEYALPFVSQQDAIGIDRHLHYCLRQAIQTEDEKIRRQWLTITVVGGGPAGVEMAATLADLLPNWYAAMNGNSEEVRVVLINHGNEILKGDINSHLRATAQQELQKRAVPVEICLGAEVTTVSPNAVEYKRDGKVESLPAYTTIWTAGNATHPLLQNLAIPDTHKDKQGRLQVKSTLQLPDYPEVFAGGDCTVVEDAPLPPTAQVAYQQGAAIAHNLKAIAFGHELQAAQVNIRGTLLKLGLTDAAANIYNLFEVNGNVGHLIRQGTYLELLPTPVHNFKATAEWLNEEIFHHYLNPTDSSKTAVRSVELVGGAIVGVLVARKLLHILGDHEQKNKAGV
ncbi:NAD(P)/FAD-dependent oxidoreductase [Anabaena minutissima FACHB-250]|nr:NAD(P)/FAD-dependent oxidoreductase [Anabaena minutissima FACHB-250]